MERAGRIIAKLRTAQKHFTREELTLAAWPAAIGKRLAGRTRAVMLQEGRLTVLVEDEQWRRNLFGLRLQILRNLGELLETAAPESIEFRIGPQRRPPAREEAVNQFSLTAPDHRPVDDADAIADPVLRRIYVNSRRKARAS